MRLHSRKYEEYIHSWKWQQTAELRRKIDHYQCAACGRPQTDKCRLQVHHITYDRIGHEDIEHDLVTLCPECHKKIHKILKPYKYADRG
ncbi:MAG: HNH endonuclease [Clostridiales bacterium]|nr:HNH endonuclease [Clostridiales bacterium]